jgi:hypothetical protein
MGLPVKIPECRVERPNGVRSLLACLPERLHDSGGFALAMAVFALVLLAAIVAGGYFSASQEYLIGRGMRSTTQSFYAGEAGLREVLEDWDPLIYNAMQPGDSVTVGPFTLDGDSLKRYFYIEAAGRISGPNRGERRQAVVVRTSYTDICCDGAVKVVNNVTFGGGAQPIISGYNNDPPGIWPASACAGIPGDSTPGVIHGPTGIVNDYSRVEGNPAVVADGGLTSANLFDFGDLTYDDLVAMANHEFVGDLTFNNTTASTVGGKCNRSDPLNWGAPQNPGSPCFDYFPIIHVTHDLYLTGAGAAQGILLVDNDLYISGPFEFYGIALVKDDLDMGGPVDVYGGMYVRDDVWFNGATPRFWLSRCASERAERLSKISRPRLLSNRAWVDLF